jgi:basic membrane protein A and related proteins
MTRSRRLLAAGFAAALGIAGVATGSGSLSASSGGGICEGIDLGALAGEAPAGTEAIAATTAAATEGTEPTATEPAGTEPAGTEPAGTEPAATEPAGTEPAGTEPAGTAAPEGTSVTEGSAVAGAVNVALLYDVTGRGDKSFNDSAAAGLDRAIADFGINPTESTPGGEGDRAERMSAAAEGGNQLVIAVGFLWADTTTQGAAAYPDTHFAQIDEVVEAPNVSNNVFAEEQGSFLAGAAAALESDDGVIGFVGGVRNALIEKFQAGYAAGAQCVNPDIEVLVEYISDDPVIGFNDAARGKEVGAAMYEAGADVVYAAAGASGVGVLEAAAEAGEPGEVWSIGVDSGLYEIVDANLQPYVLTSMLKNVDNAVYAVIEDEVNGEFEAGTTVWDLAADGVGISSSGGFIDQYAGTLDGLKALIVDGTIVVPTAPEG